MTVDLRGIDGSNPLGLLAALGALSLATDSFGDRVAMYWGRSEIAWHPTIQALDGLTEEAVIEGIVGAHQARDLDLELGWSADVMNLDRRDVRELLLKRMDRASAAAAAMVAACAGELPPRRRDQSLAPYTPFRLIPRVGRARFLATALALSRSEDSADLIAEALEGPWRYRKANSLRLDPGAPLASRAYTAEAPTHFGPLGVPGAMLLAIVGLRYFPLMLSRGRSACRGFGDSRSRTFVWPIWDEPLSEASTRLVLGHPELHVEDPDGALLRRHGVVARMIARRVRIGDDDEMISWGEPRVLGPEDSTRR